MKALIIIPTYNEIVNIESLIPRIFEETRANQYGIEYHILIVDDNSPDGTGKKAEELSCQWPVHVIHRIGKQGLGSAYLCGFKWALERDYDFIYEMDADWSHDPCYLLPMVKAVIENSYYCVIGSRFYQWRISIVNWHLKRLLLSLAGHGYCRLVLGDISVHDTTSGFKCFKREALEAINLERVMSDGFIFQLELNFRLYKAKLKIGEIPIIFRDRAYGETKLSTGIIREGLWMPLKLKALSLVKGARF